MDILTLKMSIYIDIINRHYNWVILKNGNDWFQG